MREPTQEEWQTFHGMIVESKALLSKDPDGAYNPESVRAARSAVQNALDWINALQR